MIYRTAVALMTAAIVILTLAGCAFMGLAEPADLDDRIRTACSVYARTLNAAAVQNRLGNVSDAAEARIDQAKAVIGPTCRGGQHVTTESALALIEQELIRMVEASDGTE